VQRGIRPRYRPLLLTTKTLYPRWERLLSHVRVPERRSVFVVLPGGPGKAQDSLMAVAKGYQARGRAVRVIRADAGMERYYRVRERLATRRR
jgi:hypothetical protein